MAPGSRRSTLQTEILAALAAEPAGSISALADSLEKSRPSVSRSLKRLAEGHLVEKHGRAWQLTGIGYREAEAAAESLRTSTTESARSASRKMRAVTGIQERFLHDHMTMGDMIMPSIADFAISPTFDPELVALGRLSTMADSLPLSRILGPPAMTTMAGIADVSPRAEAALNTLTGMGSLIESLAGLTSLSSRAEEAAASMQMGEVAQATGLAETMAGTTGIRDEAEEALGAIARIGDLYNSVVGVNESEITASGTVSSLVRNLIDSPDSAVAALAGPWQLHDIAALAGPIVSTQNTYASILETLAESGYALGLGAVADQSRLLSSALGAIMDVADYYSVEDIATGLVIDPDLQMVSAHLSAISSSLAGVFVEGFESLQHHDHPPISVLSDRLHNSTLPVSHYAEFSQHLLSPEVSTDLGGQYAGGHDERLGIEELDALLVQLNPAFVDKRQGAWLAFYGDNPDRLAQAAGSLRELLTMVLHSLAPDAIPSSPEDSRVTRKDRVRSIMRGSKVTTKHTLAVADAIETGYSLLCKQVHTIQRSDLALRAYMYSVESAMLMMLSKPEGEPN